MHGFTYRQCSCFVHGMYRRLCNYLRCCVEADKTQYMVMSREQTAGLSHTMKVDNSSIERVGEFKYLGRSLKN